MIRHITKGLSFVNKWISNVFKLMIVVGLSIMVGIVFYAVLSRNLLDMSIAWAEELSRLMFVWLVFSGAILGLYYKGHLGLSLLTDRMKPRTKLVFEIIAYALVAYVTYAMIVGGHRLIDGIKMSRSPALGFPTWIKYYSVVLAGYAMILISTENILTSATTLYEMISRKTGREER